MNIIQKSGEFWSYEVENMIPENRLKATFDINEKLMDVLEEMLIDNQQKISLNEAVEEIVEHYLKTYAFR